MRSSVGRPENPPYQPHPQKILIINTLPNKLFEANSPEIIVSRQCLICHAKHNDEVHSHHLASFRQLP